MKPLALLVLLAAPAAAGDAAPAVLQPLGLQAAPAAAPPRLEVSFSLAVGDRAKAEPAARQAVERNGGRVGPPSGEANRVEYLFPSAPLKFQRDRVSRAVQELGKLGVVHGQSETLVPTLEERRAQLKQEADALAAEKAALGEQLPRNPRTARLVEGELARLSAVDPEREDRAAVVKLRFTQEASPAP